METHPRRESQIWDLTDYRLVFVLFLLATP
jgi:hypothetical protein